MSRLGGPTTGVCTGSVRWDIFNRLSQHSGAYGVYDLLANDAFDYLQSTVGWVNDGRLRVRVPDTVSAGGR